MSRTAKGVVAILIIGGLVAATVGMAHAKSQPKLPKPSNDSDLDDDEVSVTIPTPGGDAEVILDAEEADNNADSESEIDDEALTDIVNETNSGPSTPIDSDLEVLAAEEGISQKDAVKDVLDTVTGGAQTPPLAVEETSSQMDPHGTVKLARIMLSREELPGWKEDLQEDVEEWQIGLKNAGFEINPDGLFGPKSAAYMATEVGIMPLVRYWPKDVASKAAAKIRYNALVGESLKALNEDLPDSQAQIDALKMSMAREQAQSFGANPGPQPTRAFVQKVNDKIAAAAEAQTEKELANV